MSDVRLVRTARMFDDPDLDGDLLLVGLAFARFLDFGGIPARQKLNTSMVARCVWPRDRWRGRAIKRTLALDARTYKPPTRHYYADACNAPMVRREGVCGRSPMWSRLVTDWETGEQSWLLACSRHVDWYDKVARENREAKPERLVVPAANHGGVLAPHIPEFGWPKIWAWATDGGWVELPEREPWKPPTFTLVLGDGNPDGPVRHPVLVPVSAS